MSHEMDFNERQKINRIMSEINAFVISLMDDKVRDTIILKLKDKVSTDIEGKDIEDILDSLPLSEAERISKQIYDEIVDILRSKYGDIAEELADNILNYAEEKDLRVYEVFYIGYMVLENIFRRYFGDSQRIYLSLGEVRNILLSKVKDMQKKSSERTSMYM